MGAFGIQLGNRETLKKKVIGHVEVYKIKVKNVDEKSNTTYYETDYDDECEIHEVVEIIETENGEFYLTNKWNDMFDDVQTFGGHLVKKFISYEE